MEPLRKLIAITLLAIFGWPVASSLFALTPKSEANLPACCRRSGKHHCFVGAAEHAKLTSDKPTFEAPPEQCPFARFPANAVPAHDMSGVIPGGAIFAGLLSHTAVFPQTPVKWRNDRDRSNQKRGPPTA